MQLAGGNPPRLAEWADMVQEFGAYYELAGTGPIPVDGTVWRRVAARLGAFSSVGPDPAGR